ncbi:MAG: DUF6297 family protein [Propionibacteriaceae bacterium]|jgi:hypothetical protein|nr:DUF6297 family protein [Propionibacteriaceae bacterium]
MSKRSNRPAKPAPKAKATPSAAEPAVETAAAARADEAFETAGEAVVSDAAAQPGDVEAVAPVWEHDLLTVEPEPVWEPDLKALIETWRRGRATRRLSQVLADGYVAVFSVVVILAMIGGAVWRVQADANTCVTGTCQTGRTLLPWVVLFGAFGLTLSVARLFGPVVASAPEGFWLFDAPLRRARLLRSRLVAVLVGVALGVAAVGGLLAALTGYGPREIGEWAAALGLGAAALTAFAALEQTRGRTWLGKLIQWLFGLAAFAALAVMTGVAAGWFGFSVSGGLWTRVVLGVAAGAVVLLAVFAFWASRRLDEIHRARLVSGGSLISGMQGAAFAMDLGLMRDILVERDALAVGQVRGTLGVGQGLMALVWREVQRLWRYPKRLIVLVVSLGVPYAVGALGLEAFNPFVSALILLVAFVPLLNSLRVITRTRGLSRMLPFSNPQQRFALVAVAAFLAVLWAVAASPAFWGLGADHAIAPSEAAIRALITALAGLLAAFRWVTAKAADYSSPMMQTGFGALPPGLMFNLVKGLDVVVVMTGPLLLGWSYWVSVVIGGLVLIGLSGAVNLKEAQQMQQELKEEQERSRGATATKKVIAPPKR